MKRFYPFAVLLFLSAFASGQEAITVEPVTKQMSKGMQNGFTTDVPESHIKEVTNGWKKYIRNKESVDENDGEIVFKSAVITYIMPTPVTVYSRLLESEKGVRLTVFFSENDSVFVNAVTSEEKSVAAKKFLRDFAIQQYKIAAGHEADVEKKRLSKLEDDLESIVKTKEKAGTRIKEDERKIEKNKDEITTLRVEKDARSAELASQKEIVRALAARP